jgi:hypothetical protein
MKGNGVFCVNTEEVFAFFYFKVCEANYKLNGGNL